MYFVWLKVFSSLHIYFVQWSTQNLLTVILRSSPTLTVLKLNFTFTFTFSLNGINVNTNGANIDLDQCFPNWATERGLQMGFNL